MSDTFDYTTLLKPYQPDVYDGVLEYEEVLKTEGVALSVAHSALSEMVALQKITTLPLDGVQSYEKIFGIFGNPLTETLEFRRQRIINRLSLKPPFSLEFLADRLNEIVGAGNWNINMDYPNHTLYVESSAVNQQWAGELAITINSVKPANIIYRPVPALFSTLLLNSETDYSQDTANYVAGNWLVGAKDIVSYENKGVINMSTTSTMKDQMMESVLSQLDSNVVVDFRFNDTLVKPAVKTVDSANNKLVVTCELLSSDLTTLTKVEVRNASGQVLDSFDTYTPIIDGITLKYVLSVKEGTA